MHLAEEDDNPADLAGLFAGTEPPAPPPSGVLAADRMEKKAGSSAGGIFLQEFWKRKIAMKASWNRSCKWLQWSVLPQHQLESLPLPLQPLLLQPDKAQTERQEKCAFFQKVKRGWICPQFRKRKKKQGADLNPKKKLLYFV